MPLKVNFGLEKLMEKSIRFYVFLHKNNVPLNEKYNSHTAIRFATYVKQYFIFLKRESTYPEVFKAG